MPGLKSCGPPGHKVMQEDLTGLEVVRAAVAPPLVSQFLRCLSEETGVRRATHQSARADEEEESL